MQPHLEAMLWRRRGASPLSASCLQRLYDLNPHFRVGFTPRTPDQIVAGRVVFGRPALWWLYETRPHNAHDAARRRAGRARLARWERASVAYRAAHPATPAQCEEMIEGLWVVGSWPPDPLPARDQAGRVLHTLPAFGSDEMIAEVVEGERAFHEAAARLERELRLDQTADEDVRAEYEENPEYRAYLRDGYQQVAKEDWALIFSDRKSAVLEQPVPWKEETGARTDG